MTRNAFLTLAAVAIIAAVLAGVAVLQQPRLRAPDVAGEQLFPGLSQKLNTLKSVVVRHSDGTMTFDWNGKMWVARDRAGFPADGEKINGVIVQIARMVKVEAKTAVADKLDRLDLNDPTAKDSRAKQITLLDKDGKVLADVIVGKRKFTLGGKEGGTYVRLPDSSQSWLALGDLNPGNKPRDWLKREIADLKDKQIKRITVTHPDGEKVVVGKKAPTDTSFKIENMPSGREPATDFVADEFGRVLAVMLLDDVAKAEEIPFPADKTINAEFEGFEGLRVALQMTEAKGATWVKIKATAPEAKTLAPQQADETKPGEAAPSAPEAPADWGKTAADITTRGEGWAFQVPAYEVAPLKKRMAELVKKPEPKS